LEIYNSDNAIADDLLGSLCNPPGDPYISFHSTGQDMYILFRSNVTYQAWPRDVRNFVIYYSAIKPGKLNYSKRYSFISVIAPCKIIQNQDSEICDAGIQAAKEFGVYNFGIPLDVPLPQNNPGSAPAVINPTCEPYIVNYVDSLPWRNLESDSYFLHGQ
jgi:hypothetical protein